MKIIYLTDIHGDFEKLKNLLSETLADVYIIAGDLIDIPFYSMDTSMLYHELQSFFHGLRIRMGSENTLIEDFVDELLESPDATEEIQEKGTQFQEYTIRARRVMQQKYKVLENIISAKRNSNVLCLPGNYDMDLKYTSLHDNDLHLHWRQIDDMKICGYGGADVRTPGIPERYIVKYQAGMGKNEKQNEMYQFFRAVKPNIIVAHQPAYGVHDRMAAGGPFGSPSLRSYCDNNAVSLCLTGHIHNAWGAKEVESTLYLNPSNFGEVTTASGSVSEGGFFYQIELADCNVVSFIFKKIIDHNIIDIADYSRIKGLWHEDIVDAERYHALQMGQNFDMQEVKYSHIPEIQLYKEIREFYRTFQTQATEDRIDKLEEVVRSLEDKVEGDIAFDVMGSVNMGLSLPGSDIDFVIYLRCENECCTTIFSECGHFKKVQAMIKDILGQDYEFQILDCLNLNEIEHAILERNYESEMLQRFVAYRSICRPIHYRVIAPTEDMLNKDMVFRKEIEGSIQSYFKIFTSTSSHIRSLRNYEARLNALGIKLPESVKLKIKKYLGED
jgi:Icc-related predicted phosphoesterase